MSILCLFEWIILMILTPYKKIILNAEYFVLVMCVKNLKQFPLFFSSNSFCKFF